jgi:hypothetical protein
MRQLVVCLFVLPAFSQALKLEAVPNPSMQGSLQAHWGTAPDGSPLLSWIDSASGSYNLRYAIRHGNSWSEVRTVAAGRHFWRHPAELPELVSLADGTLFAHWVEKAKDSSDAEDIFFVSSSRDGVHWTEPVMAHRDRSAVQHGLASMVASGSHEASIFWLLLSDFGGEDLQGSAGCLSRSHAAGYPRHRRAALGKWQVASVENFESGQVADQRLPGECGFRSGEG